MSLAAKCCLCTDEFSSIDDLEAHISADHFNCLPFECEKCKFAKFPTEFAIKRHYEEDHGLVEYFVRYRVSREIYEKKQKVRECLERCVCHTTPAPDVGTSHQNQQIGGVAKTPISVEYSHHSHQYQTQHHLHESEFLTPSKIRRNAQSPTDIFQSQHRSSTLPTTIAASEIRHHQPELLGNEIGGNEHDSVAGFHQIGASSLMGNLLEHIKPDMDGNVLSHFDQLYAADIAQSADGAKGIEKVIVAAQQQDHHDLGSILSHHKTPTQVQNIGVGATGINVVNTGLIGKTQLGVSIGTALCSSHSTTGIGSRKPPELQCQVCKQMVVNRSTSLMYHVNVKHIKLALFKCKQCGEEFLWNRPAANRHAKRHGGDESLIENNTERLFPILNRHRREYFNLPYGKSSTSPVLTLKEISAENEDQRMEQDMQMNIPKEEAESGDELNGQKKVEVDVGENQQQQQHMEKEGQSTPNTILAQLIDMTRGGDTAAASPTRQSDDGPTSSTTLPPTTPSIQEEVTKIQKSVKCGGCGDLVINQEWILLNHVNTKHLHLPLYKCVSCDKPFENYLRSYAVRHAKFYHAGDESLLLDQRDQFWSGLRDACTRLFGIGKNGMEH